MQNTTIDDGKQPITKDVFELRAQSLISVKQSLFPGTTVKLSPIDAEFIKNTKESDYAAAINNMREWGILDPRLALSIREEKATRQDEDSIKGDFDTHVKKMITEGEVRKSDIPGVFRIAKQFSGGRIFNVVELAKTGLSIESIEALYSYRAYLEHQYGVEFVEPVSRFHYSLTGMNKYIRDKFDDFFSRPEKEGRDLHKKEFDAYYEHRDEVYNTLSTFRTHVIEFEEFTANRLSKDVQKQLMAIVKRDIELMVDEFEKATVRTMTIKQFPEHSKDVELFAKHLILATETMELQFKELKSYLVDFDTILRSRDPKLNRVRKALLDKITREIDDISNNRFPFDRKFPMFLKKMNELFDKKPITEIVTDIHVRKELFDAIDEIVKMRKDKWLSAPDTTQPTPSDASIKTNFRIPVLRDALSAIKEKEGLKERESGKGPDDQSAGLLIEENESVIKGSAAQAGERKERRRPDNVMTLDVLRELHKELEGENITHQSLDIMVEKVTDIYKNSKSVYEREMEVDTILRHALKTVRELSRGRRRVDPPVDYRILEEYIVGS